MSKRIPNRRPHKPTGQAVVTLNGKDHYLGRYDSPESEAEYNRLIAQWLANNRQLLAGGDGPTVAEVALAFWKHVEEHYRHPDGSPTTEVANYELSLRPLRHLYAHTLAKDFGPLALKAVRRLMVQGYEHPDLGTQPGLARGLINQRVGRIKRMFRRTVENELVPPAVFQGLQAVRGLERGRSQARDTEPVKPVPEAFVRAVLPFVREPVWAMVELQLLTGMRPGEICVMRACDLDMNGAVWLYRVRKYKNAWRGPQPDRRHWPEGASRNPALPQARHPSLFVLPARGDGGVPA